MAHKVNRHIGKHEILKGFRLIGILMINPLPLGLVFLSIPRSAFIEGKGTFELCDLFSMNAYLHPIIQLTIVVAG